MTWSEENLDNENVKKKFLVKMYFISKLSPFFVILVSLGSPFHRLSQLNRNRRWIVCCFIFSQVFVSILKGLFLSIDNKVIIVGGVIYFQHSLFLEITTLVTWLKSTVLLKISLVHMFIWKHNVYKQIEHSIIRRGKCLKSRVGKEKSGALIKSLIDEW